MLLKKGVASGYERVNFLSLDRERLPPQKMASN